MTLTSPAICLSDRRDEFHESPECESHNPAPRAALSNFVSGMVSVLSSDQASSVSEIRISEGLSALASLGSVAPHESPDTNSIIGSGQGTSSNQGAAYDETGVANRPPISESSSLRLARKQTLWHRYQDLVGQGLSQAQAATRLGASNAMLSRMSAIVREQGIEGLADKYHQSGRKPKLILTPEEEARLQALFLKTNRHAEGGSMQTACKFFALDPQTREEVSTAILSQQEKGLLPMFAMKCLRQITKAHFAAHRKPGKLAADHFAGRVGAFSKDKFERRRAVESDDATLNFPAWIPWPQGGDPVSDKYGVKLGRWQFLPAIEAGWSQYYLGYSLVARPRGSYTQEDVRGVISMVARHHGLPDEFRFERGIWESDSVVELLRSLGVELNTVWQSNQKPFVEGGLSTLWTYLSMVDGQVGRFQGEMEKANLDVERCRAGRLDPREVFPSLTATHAALKGALAMRNSDRRQSKTYGSWIPEVRYREQAQEKPWRPLPPELNYLFAPIVREWTVQKGTVGNSVSLTEDLKAPFYFFHEELWRSNGQKVRVYFDPAAPQCTATIVCVTPHLCWKPGQIMHQATLLGEIPHFTRAAMGWQDPASTITPAPGMRGPLSAVRREVRALAPGGRVISTASEERDGHGTVNRIEHSSPGKPSEGQSPRVPQIKAPARPRSTAPIDPDEETISLTSTDRHAALAEDDEETINL